MRHSKLLLALVAATLCSTEMLAQDGMIPVIHYFDEQDGFLASHVSAATQTRDGYVWFATWSGLKRYDGYRFKSYKLRPGDGNLMPTNSIYNLRELADGNILCETTRSHYIFNRAASQFTPCALRGKIGRFKAKSEDVARWEKSMGGQVGNSAFLCVDRQGGVWGFDKGRLFRLWYKPDFESYGSEKNVRALYVDHKGILWIGNLQGHVLLVGQNRKKLGYISPQGTIGSRPERFGDGVYCFFEDSQGTYWLGTKPGGLYHLTPRGKRFDVRHYASSPASKWSLSDNSVYSIAEDRFHRLWVATWGGGLNVSTDIRKPNVMFANKNNLLRQYPSKAMQVRLLMPMGSVMMACTNNGLLTCNTNLPLAKMKFHVNTRSANRVSSIGDNNVMSILHSRDNSIYVAAYGGGIYRVLSKDLLSDSIRFESLNNGLASDAVHGMVEDGYGNIWVVSEGGISRFNKAMATFDYYANRLFSHSLYSLEANPVVLPDGEIVLGTVNGLFKLNPKRIIECNYKPKILFDCSDSIMLKSDERVLQVEFAAIDFNQTAPIRYAYRTDGIDSCWVYTSDPHVRYTNIPPGDYRLRVRSTNGMGVWCDNEKSIWFHRNASFNETPFAWLLYSSLLLLSLYIIIEVIVYIRRLNKEISDLQVSMGERVAYLSNRIEELIKFRTTGERTRSDMQPASMPPDFKEKMEKLLRNKMAESDLSVNDIAREMGMSRTVLYLNMKRAFGCTVNEKLFNMRMKKAAQQLDETNRPVADIAYACGFSDPKYFSRSFKKAIGMTPTEYRSRDANAALPSKTE